MNEAWLSTFALARESSLLGAAAGDHIKIPGVRTVHVAPEVVKRHESKDIFRRLNHSEVIHQSWTITISREFALDAFADLWLDAVADGPGITAGDITTRTHRRDRDPVTFTADATVPGEDTVARRFRGMTLQSVELIVQARRVIIEESRWVVLRNEDLPIADAEAGSYALRPPLTAIQARGAIKLGSGAWTPATEHTDVFSGQVIIQREISPAYWNEDGVPTRFSNLGPFECLGRAIVSPTFGNYSATLAQAAPCRLFWSIGSTAQRLEIESLTGTVKDSGGNILHSGDSTRPLDWMTRTNGAGTFITRRIDS